MQDKKKAPQEAATSKSANVEHNREQDTTKTGDWQGFSLATTSLEAASLGLTMAESLCTLLAQGMGEETGGPMQPERVGKRLPRPLPACGAHLQTDAEPGYFPPQTLRLSAGRSNHLGLFRWKNLAQFFPTLRRELTKKKGRGTMSTTPTGCPCVCLLAGARAFFMPPSCAWTHDAGRALGRPETCGPEDFMSRNPPC